MSPNRAMRPRSMLLAGVAAMLGIAPAAHAQSFQGSATVAGNATVTNSTGHTQVDLAGDRAIITWTPTDTATGTTSTVNFQPAGTSATFSSAASGLTDFTVLNIVNAPGSRVIGLNGSVNSTVSDGHGGAVTGGSVWFYSQNGFLVGGSASFDVGSLLLTADRPQGIDDPTSPDGLNHNFNTQTQRLTIVPGSSGAIQIAAGAQINASNYVALVAPHISQAGTVRAAGEIAYVGAESVDMTMPVGSGLFGIAVITGTDGTAIAHTGITGGPASQNLAQPRNIYMITVPKNDAVTMLLGGAIGYDGTVSASQSADGTILLAGGSGAVSGGQIVAGAALNSLPATIAVDGAEFTNTLTAFATGITIDATGPLTMASATATDGDLIVTAGDALSITSATASGAAKLASTESTLSVTTLTVGNGATLTAAGAIGVSDAIVSGAFSATGLSVGITADNDLTLTTVTATGGNVTLAALDGALSVARIVTPRTASLTASGTVTANDIAATGGVTARGTTLDLASSGALTLNDATAITGSLTARAAGDLTVTAASAGSDMTLASSGGSISIASASAGGTLGADAATAIGVGTVSADAISLRARSGAIAATSLSAPGAVTLQASGAVTVDDFAGSAASAADGSSVTLTASGALALAHAGATAGDIVLTSDGNLSLTQANATGAITLRSTTGAVSAAGLASGAAGVTATGTNVALGGSGALIVTDATATTGTIALTSVGDMTIASAHAAGALGATSSGGSITTADVASGGALSLTAGQAITFTTLTGSSLDLDAIGGALSGATLSTAGTATLRAGGAIAVTGNLAASGGADVSGASVAVTATGPLTLTNATATAGDLTLTDASDLVVGTASASGAARITSTGGSVRVTDATTGGDLAIGAAAGATLDGTIGAGGAVTVAATDATVTGHVTGRTIGFASHTMTIGSAARIGTAGTTTNVTFTNSGTQPSFVGGTSGNGYLLTAAGLDTVQADAITLNLPAIAGSSATNPDVTIGDLTLHGSTGTASGTLANLTANGSFTINTPGRVLVNGTLQLADGGTGNSVAIVAGPEIDVVTPNGAILLTDSSGAPAGSLDLTAQRIVAATQSAIADLAGITDTAARNTRLSNNDGVTSDQGFLAANHLTFTITDALDVQNSGGAASAARRGVTAGSGGVDVVVSGSGTPEVILNGRQVNGTGLTVRVTAANGGTTPTLAPGSAVNACTLGTIDCGTPDIGTLLALAGPQQDVVGMLSDSASGENDKKSADSSKKPPRIVISQPLMAFPRPNASSIGVVIDEPVIGVPNEALWNDLSIGAASPPGGQ